ncbi:diadenosine hexaphosphate hydrolase (ATP-forming) [Candidatus Brocadiaceae bacterium]|nr:diadenosine hexaphosphate hydrolase (ATP-forming) [Candidatus Brocadiaceae bacterium]
MRKYPIPAVGVVIENGDEILLIKKGRGIFKGQWCIPGGKIECGEQIIETIHREVFEETNVYVSNPQFITFQEYIDKQISEKLKHFVFFNFKVNYVKGEPKANDDAEEAKFFTKETIAKLNLSEPTIKTFKVLGYME